MKKNVVHFNKFGFAKRKYYLNEKNNKHYNFNNICFHVSYANVCKQ